MSHARSTYLPTATFRNRKYYHPGSPRTTVDVDGNVLGYDDYYPFGLVMPGRSSNSANPNDNYKFTGHERDDEAGLNLDYMMARNYDPIIGRFLQVDPSYAKYPAWSPYAYTFNNPMLFTDPDGKDPCGYLCKVSLKGAFGPLHNVFTNLLPSKSSVKVSASASVNTGNTSYGLGFSFSSEGSYEYSHNGEITGVNSETNSDFSVNIGAGDNSAKATAESLTMNTNIGIGDVSVVTDGTSVEKATLLLDVPQAKGMVQLGGSVDSNGNIGAVMRGQISTSILDKVKVKFNATIENVWNPKEIGERIRNFNSSLEESLRNIQ